MDAHLRYFKQGYELLSQLESFIHQVLTYAQQSKEMANSEQDKLAKRIQEFRTQAEIASLRSLSNTDTSTSGDGIHVVGVHPYKKIEALMQSTANGEISFGNSERQNLNSADGNDSDSLWLEDGTKAKGHDKVSQTLRSIPGNDICAECSAPEPDWASLNLGILVCIECSGVHRNLGVHISKVRSLTLDVKVWEPAIIDLFRALGNSYCNSVWEGLLLNQDESMDESEKAILSVEKPNPNDSFSRKEKFIQSKYVDKNFIIQETIQPDRRPPSASIWEAVKDNDIRGAYHLLVLSGVSPNTRYDDLNNELNHLLDTPKSNQGGSTDRKQFDPANCQKINDSGQQESCLQGCSLLHLACHIGDPIMLELLLQFGADINSQDFHGRTPLHHCIFKKNDNLAKYLLRRGARTTPKDGGGLTTLERRMELGAITDEELFILFVGHE